MVIVEDERMSTKLAERLTAYKGVAEQDAVAAAVILQGYLERRKVIK
jgi:RNase H-fold protein (predicted Holliday junction resolvase)